MLSKASHSVIGLIAAIAVSHPAQAQLMEFKSQPMSFQNCILKPQDCGLSSSLEVSRTWGLRPPTITCMSNPISTCGKFVVSLKTLNPGILEALKDKYHVVPIKVESQIIPSGDYFLILPKLSGTQTWFKKPFTFDNIQHPAGAVNFTISSQLK